MSFSLLILSYASHSNKFWRKEKYNSQCDLNIPYPKRKLILKAFHFFLFHSFNSQKLSGVLFSEDTWSDIPRQGHLGRGVSYGNKNNKKYLWPMFIKSRKCPDNKNERIVQFTIRKCRIFFNFPEFQSFIHNSKIQQF